MRWERLTVSPRKLGAVAGTVAVLVIVVLSGAVRAPVEPAGSPAPPASVPTQAPPVAAAAPDRHGAADPVGAADHGVVDEPPGGAAEEAEAAAFAAAQQVAADFAVGYATHHFADGPSATADRVRAFVTDELAAELSRNSGAVAGREERAAREEHATAVVQAVQHQAGSVGDGVLDLLVVVRQDVSWRDGAEVRWPTYLVQVAHAGGQWRVTRLLP